MSEGRKKSGATRVKSSTRKKPRLPMPGREKGSVNVNSQKIIDVVNEYLRERGYPSNFDPAFILAEMALQEMHKKIPNKDRLAFIASKLMPYYHPTRRAVEFEPSNEELPVLRVILTDEGNEMGKVAGSCE